MSDPIGRVGKLLIQAMAKHLPPSAVGLRLLDVNGTTGPVLLAERPDLDLTAAPADGLASLPDGGFDAVTAYDIPLDSDFLAQVRRLLRPGGRLITVDSELDPDEGAVHTLEQAGYTRILVETGVECPLPVGRLARGEQPHLTDDTLARVAGATARDARAALEGFRGRSVHLLIQQTPNLPAWKRPTTTPVVWQAVALAQADGPELLAFTSLPAAVAFMQSAVLAGTVRDVNKVAKFPRETALTWSWPILLNPEPQALTAVAWLPIDPALADTPEE